MVSTTADYTRPVLVTRDGAVTEVTLNDVQIPDLWHVSGAAGDAIDRLAEIERLIDRFNDGEDYPDGATRLLDKVLGLARREREAPETQDGKRIREELLSVWHTAIDLKKNLAGDVGKPAKKRKGGKA